jgi:hypothetical protein
MPLARYAVWPTRTGPCLLAARHHSDFEERMSEQIDVQTDSTIAGAAGNAVRAERAALTRWVAAEPAGPVPAGAGVHCASGCAEEVAARNGDPREPHHRLRPDPPGSAATTAADRTRGYDARCAPLLARLRLLARQDAGTPLPPGAVGEVGHTASAIIAETDAAGHAAVAAVADSSRRSAAVFLAARQARLAAAADDVVAAAKDGSAAALSRHLRRFEALTSALWTVQHAICAPAHRRPQPAHLAAPAP